MLSGRRVCSRSGKATFSNTVRFGEERANWQQHAHPPAQPIQARLVELVHGLARDAHGACARARSWPPIRRSSVVLPQPLPPMIATTLPRGTRIVMPLRIGRMP